MVSLGGLLPEVAKNETKCVTLNTEEYGLAPGKYEFHEMYCMENQCDCRRAMIRVYGPGRQLHATLSYGWESRSFYWKWFPDEDFIENVMGANLYELQPQGNNSERVLELFKSLIRSDASYTERIKRHYFQLKRAVEKENEKVMPVSIKTRKKVGRNDSCPCGSGIKFKKCCLDDYTESMLRGM